MAADVSVVVPALNEADYLEDGLASVRDQTSDAVDEIVVVDGGSQDGTPAVARSQGAASWSNRVAVSVPPATRGRAQPTATGCCSSTPTRRSTGPTSKNC